MTRESKVAQALRAIGVINSWDVATIAHAADLPDVFINYSAAVTGRGYRSANWSVISVSHKTDPKAHWTDHGNKAFHVYRVSDRAPKLEEAQKWVAGKYGITEWAKIPGLADGPSWFPKVVAVYIQSLLQEAKK